jgi:molybdenum cofactor guanylyltransferase
MFSLFPKNTLTGVILAGGSSSRMGRDKALIPIEGVPMIQRIAETMRTVFETVYIVSDHFEQYSFLHLPGVRDTHSGCGPLGGVHTALSTLNSAAIFVLASDTPFVPKELITYIIHEASDTPVCVAREGERIHPLCGVYQRICLPALTACVASGRLKMMPFLEEVGATLLPVDARLSWYHVNLLLNINTPDDIPPSGFLTR